ncbi:hypothetical protein CZ787_13945 [Halomonas citrativorans]|uniref:Uncharacterized protein n=1 Tax=Halomonas citrativorans TaxID=2742612 RepID=A0A1R4I392_9GAMM|nr:hypothetical protein CZ787_13945 [Halomonas citrativorans]
MGVGKICVSIAVTSDYEGLKMVQSSHLSSSERRIKKTV